MIIGGIRGNQVGLVVTCIRLLGPHEHTADPILGPIWFVDTILCWNNGVARNKFPWAPDKCLMPINPLDDETVETQDVLHET